jgi:hypothetical protein
MESIQRRQLAHDLCQRLADHYPSDLLLGGVYGSTARGTDTQWSDLELWFVVQDGCPAHGQQFLFQGSPVGYRIYQQSDLEAILTHPSEKWPFHMGVLSVLQVLQGDPAQIEKWLSMGLSVPEDRFHTALEILAPSLVMESYGRIHTKFLQSAYPDMLPAVLEVLFEMRTAMCLLNQRWCTHDYYAGLEDTFAFPRLPEGYQDLVLQLYHTRRPVEILSLSDQLVANYKQLLVETGIQARDFARVSEIPV